MRRSDRDSAGAFAITQASENPVVTQATTSPTPSPAALQRGAVVGRYVVDRRLGSGGMGVVMSAFDPTLDRKIALKLVAPGRGDASEGVQRLQREAQAMARLSHPNVLTVFEVGTYGDDVFLAMELVDGVTLGEWLAERSRSRGEIVSAFVDAGRGLAAAHRAGIVHRDFKPSNVLIARDGRVRVADFGLATAPTVRASSAPPAESAAPLDMTVTGAVLGTPAYMSPEQHRGQPADARADQFAFCAALYHALYGELPFSGDDYAAYAENVLAGRVRTPRRGRAVPARIRRALLRGLAVDPEQRFRTMDELLAELARDPAARRKRIAIVGAAVVAAGGIGVLWPRCGGADDPCEAAAQPVAAIWQPAARRSLEQAFAASTAPRAADAAARVARLFDDRQESLRTARRDACAATSVRHEQSSELLDRRMQCIDQRASELRALIAVLSDHPDAKTVDKAVEAALALPPLARCADREALLAAYPPPVPALHARVAELNAMIDRATALLDAGKPAAAESETAAVITFADGLGYPPLLAHAHFVHAQAQSTLGHYQQAVAELEATGELAATARDDELLARGAVLRYGIVGYRLARLEQARALDSSAAAAVARAGSGPELSAMLDNSRGAVALAAADYKAAADRFKAAAREFGEAYGSNAPRSAGALANAGTALENLGRYDDARVSLQRALAIRIESLGPDHPSVAASHYALGTLLDTMGQPDNAMVELRAAIEIFDKASPDSASLAEALLSEGIVLNELHHFAEAAHEQERALAIFERDAVNNAAELPIAMADLGVSYRNLGRVAEAVRIYEQALARAEQVFGPDHPKVADVLHEFVATEIVAKHADRALALAKRALAIREAKLGPDHPDVARSLATLAELAEDRRDHREVIRAATRAIAILDRVGGHDFLDADLLDGRGRANAAIGRYADAATDLARAVDLFDRIGRHRDAAAARLHAADAHWAHRERTDAIAAGRAALAELVADPAPDPKLLAEVRAWLASHR